MGKSREQFEKVYESKFKHLPNDPHKGVFWFFWQASRESLEIELPKSEHVKAYDFYTDGYNSGIERCETILENLNIKVARK